MKFNTMRDSTVYTKFGVASGVYTLAAWSFVSYLSLRYEIKCIFCNYCVWWPVYNHRANTEYRTPIAESADRVMRGHPGLFMLNSVAICFELYPHNGRNLAKLNLLYCASSQ